MPEQVNVSVAQNLHQDDGRVAPMSTGKARGRGFHDGRPDPSDDAIDRGLNAEEQWRRAIELDGPFVMVTGWNEWVAGRFEAEGMPVMFVDQFDRRFSRDIEPMAGGHTDNYYWQLAANIRRYKGAPSVPAASPAKTIRIDGGFEQWLDVLPEYRDHQSETLPRDHAGVGRTHYANHSGRNDLLAMKVARDSEYVYFHARCREPMTPWSDPNWMMLLIDCDQDTATGWEGFDYILNRRGLSPDRTSIEKHDGGWTWEKVGEAAYCVAGEQLQIAVPRRALGLDNGKDAVSLDFKWIDNWRRPGDVMDFYISGDVAPEGRFKYRYTAEPAR